MSLRKSAKRVASVYLENKGFFPPELIGAETDGALLYESDEESYMHPNFSAQIYRELSDRQKAGELSDGQPITEQRAPQGGRKGERIASSSLLDVLKEIIISKTDLTDRDKTRKLYLIKHWKRTYGNETPPYEDIVEVISSLDRKEADRIRPFYK